jgi:hypothetical protein
MNLKAATLNLCGLLSIGMAAAQPAPTTPVVLGGNLEGVADWSYSNVFADLVKQSRGFGPPSAPWSGTVPIDGNGWPTVDFGVILATWTGMNGVAGTYKISCVCSTTPTIGLVASPGVIKNVVRNSSTGVVTADLVYPAGGSQLMLSFTNTHGGVRSLQVMRPGYKTSDVFTTPFLSHCARLSVARFMDFAVTNGSSIQHWTERTLPSAPSYSSAAGAQVPWEVCIALCNKLDCDAWINIPAEADDNYVQNLAQLLHGTLNPALHVYLEYSNEVWNWGFQQATWNLNQAIADVNAGDPDLNYDHVNDKYAWAARRIAKRIRTISNDFRSEYGTAGWTKSVRPVLATQIAWPAYWLVDGLTFANARFGPPNNYLYACAGAPYFNLGTADQSTNLTKAQVLQALTSSVNEQKTDLNMDACATLARFYNLKFVGYEGGPDTSGPNNIAAKKAASLDPGMQTLCAAYLNVWFGYGFDLLNWFVAGATSYESQYGTWGLTNDMTDQTAPKIKAYDQVKGQGTAKLTEGIVVPGNIDPREFCFRDANWKSEGGLVLRPTDWRGPYRDYLLQVQATGSHPVTLSVGTDEAGVKVEIWLNNALLGTETLPNTGGLSKYEKTSPLSVKMNAGMNVIRIKIVAGDQASVSQIAVG